MKKICSLKQICSLAALFACGIITTSLAQAALVSSSINDNDCKGYFNDYTGAGTGFDSCQIFANDSTGAEILISPVIAKFEDLDGDPQVNSLYPSISSDGSEWTFSNRVDGADPADEDISGDWTYSPSGDDPGIRYWAAKAGNDFLLFWDVDQTAIDSAMCSAGTSASNLSLTCLSLANTVNSGSWTTPGDKNLSHLTFYDSDPPSLVPVPAAVWLFGTALVGFIGMSRRTKV